MFNWRRQFPVGQGGFHASELICEEEWKLRFVYDCGAMSTYAAQRDARIDQYIQSVGVGSQLDMLMISHAHADHLNGIERLLDSKTGLRVDSIILPFMEFEERLFAYARSVASDVKGVKSELYKKFILSPSDALARFNPGRIIFFRSGGIGPDKPGAPGSDERFPLDRGPDVPPLLHSDSVPKWKFVGAGRVDIHDEKQNAPQVLTLDDSIAMKIFDHKCGEWLLAPYVDPTVMTKAAAFYSALAKELGKRTRLLKNDLKELEKRKELITKNSKELAAAYKAIESDINVTSMSLYSGPSNSSKSQVIRSHFGGWDTVDYERVAWLGTGDAALADHSRRDTFLAHYGKLLRQVGTLMLPHHGSDRNFHEDLISRIKPRLFFAAADKIGKWRHPGSRVIQLVASSGNFVSVVTSSPDSAFEERIQT